MGKGLSKSNLSTGYCKILFTSLLPMIVGHIATDVQHVFSNDYVVYCLVFLRMPVSLCKWVAPSWLYITVCAVFTCTASTAMIFTFQLFYAHTWHVSMHTRALLSAMQDRIQIYVFLYYYKEWGSLRLPPVLYPEKGCQLTHKCMYKVIGQHGMAATTGWPPLASVPGF